MTDIVERLRDNSPYQGSLIDTAADEIERLRADFNTAKSELQHLTDLCKKNLAHWQDALGKLSASQAREVKLRESLDRLKSACQGASYLDCDVIERLQGELAVAHGQIRYLMKDQAVKFDLLAESQAREAKLRESLDRLKSACQGASYFDCDVIENVANETLGMFDKEFKS